MPFRKVVDIQKKEISNILPYMNLQSSKDAIIACNIVKLIFRHINICIQTDRSSVKLGAFEKGIIKSMLGEKTENGINKYLVNMYPMDVKKLMNDIEIEISKRNKMYE